MLSDKKILITGLTGQIGYPVARFLADNNEVWGAARFTSEGSFERVKNLGITPFNIDLNTGNYKNLPNNFSHVIHFAAFQELQADFDLAISTNAEATG